MKGDDAVAQFMAGKSPMYVRVPGTRQLSRQDQELQVGPVHVPDAEISSSARPADFVVVPKDAKNKDLAYDFIDIVIARKTRPTRQCRRCGARRRQAAVTDPVGKQVSTMFAKIAGKGGLGLYPDWPVPGYYETLRAGVHRPDRRHHDAGGIRRAPPKEAYDEAQANQ